MNKASIALALAATLTIAAGEASPADEPSFEPYLRAGFLGNASSETIMLHPYIFREGTWVQFDLDESGNLLICVAGHGMGDCVFTHEPSGNLVGASLAPNCQGDGTIAFTYEVERDPEPNILVYFVDGYATLDRDEAESWANETEGCTFDTLDLEW